jgi:hypothetical protein
MLIDGEISINYEKWRDPPAASFILDNTKLLMAFHGLAIGYPEVSQPSNPSRK